MRGHLVNTGVVAAPPDPVATELVPVGPDALLARVGDPVAALSLALHARAAHAPAVEIVPAAVTVLFDGVTDHDLLRSVIERWSPSGAPATGPVVELPTSYDGPDLEDVARLWGTDPAGVVDRHQATTFTAAFCGFAPGFAYLTGLPVHLAVPRLDSPRTWVPVGSVALADTWCGVYPTASPGGWRIIGCTDVDLWDVARSKPALLAPGTRVRFVAR
ncbi:allophanate hydrolase subunit 1 [soil metagenome]